MRPSGLNPSSCWCWFSSRGCGCQCECDVSEWSACGSGNSSFWSKRARWDRIDFDYAAANEPRDARSILDIRSPPHMHWLITHCSAGVICYFTCLRCFKPCHYVWLWTAAVSFFYLTYTSMNLTLLTSICIGIALQSLRIDDTLYINTTFCMVSSKLECWI